MSGNNSSYAHWKPNVSPSQSISMATLTAIPNHGEYLMAHPSYAATLQRHHPHLHHQIPHLHQPQLLSPHSPSMAAAHQIDVYSQLGMQRLGQMYKAANVIQNNNNNNNNTNNNNHSSSNGSSAVSSTGQSQAKAIADATNKESNANNVQQLVESAIGTEAKQQIMQILEKISMLQPPERLLLYMRMPSSTSETDPLRQPQNPLGTRSEINHTINWVRSHLEHDPNVSIPKQDVYEDYVAYCTREDIKPLSTADFGKVMKQIFPGIRPRRLGTRGNSRYCYAAMRKTTKLDCPYLPNLSDTKNATAKFGKNTASGFVTASASGGGGGGGGTAGGDGAEASGESWKIIKTWAEGLLNTEFHNVIEMAEYISTNYMNGTSAAMSNSSRALLQKKLLQRKVKGRKKNLASMSTDTVSGLKKRRKKKLKNTISLTTVEDMVDDRHSPATSPAVAPAAPATPGKVTVPEEMLLIKQEQKSGSAEQQQQQMMPINLKTGDGTTANAIKSEFKPMSPEQTYPNVVCKIELDETNMEIEQTFHCKKVKRAQESKGLTISVTAVPSQPMSPKAKSTTQMSPASVLMRPPNYHNHIQSQATDLSVNSVDSTDCESNVDEAGASVTSDSATHGSNKRGITSTPARTKKLRFLKQASVAGMNETKVDDITTDIIIPRERVISICNLDKDALDDYLNEGDNSQEQEAELLQYFQPSDDPDKATPADATVTANTNTTAVGPLSTTATLPTPTSVASSETVTTAAGPYPLVENYNLYQQQQQQQQQQEHQQPSQIVAAQMPNQIAGMQPRQRKADQISELRQYLQQNLLSTPHTNEVLSNDRPPHPNESNTLASNTVPNLLPNAITSPQPASFGNIPVTSATIAIPKNKFIENAGLRHQPAAPPQLMRSVSASAAVGVAPLQSPNSRRKNFSFVPISPGPQSPRPFVHHTANTIVPGGNGLIIASNMAPTPNVEPQSPFVSPRVTPAIRKPINKDLMSCLNSLNSDPMIGSYKTAFSKPNLVRSDISASAPVSPSITPQHFNFQSSIMYGTGVSSSSSSSNQTQIHQTPQQYQATCAVSGMCPILESRSQSVPLHCQSPAFNSTTDTNTAYSSTCNSIAQTPVPSEFADFSDENILNILAESSAEQNIKLEVNDIPDLIETDLGHSMLNARNHMNISRSVPSTPLPLRGFGSHNLPPLNSSANANLTLSGTATTKIDFDISKSMPTTPGRNCTPFRYSPEHHRDFLINGNTIETLNKGNQFYATSQSQPSTPQQLQQPHSHNTASPSSSIPPNELDDLSNYSDVNDPIIDGSDLLHL